MESSRSDSGPNAGFLDLPGELRNEVYHYALRTDNEQRLVLKQKHNSNGSIYIKEQTPTLYHTLPVLREEIMSIYYASNSFRISLTTSHRRMVFEKWVQERGVQLKDLKRLKVGVKMQRTAFNEGRQAVMQIGCSLQISLDMDGQLEVLHAFQGTPYCRLCSINSHFQARRQALSTDAAAGLVAIGSRHTERLNNPVVSLALGVCRTLEAVHRGETEYKAVRWLVSAGGSDRCGFCPAKVEISVL